MVRLRHAAALGVLARASSDLYTLPVRHEPFAALEHVNLNIGETWTEALDSFFFEVLRCTQDPRSHPVLAKTNEARLESAQDPMGELRWVNVGLQQFHLPANDSVGGPVTQNLRGDIVLAWPRSAMPGLHQRLERWFSSQRLRRRNDDNATAVGFLGEAADPGSLRFVGPNGMRFVVEADDEGSWFGPALSGLGDDRRDAPPGGRSEGLGIRSLRLDVPPSTARRICRFYEDIFNADTRLLDGRCVLFVGFAQSIEFIEESSSDNLPAYDGPHIALYVANFDAFVDSYERAKSFVFHNPRSPQFSFSSIERVLFHDEFRFKDITDLDTGELLYELEHEIRALSHDGFTLKHRLPSSDSDDNETRRPSEQQTFDGTDSHFIATTSRGLSLAAVGSPGENSRDLSA
eukprot:CAMPEP_0198656760 /NCGR_PEP_ID=MMETSP1467-20131203/10852_1 /TAXON_ID=1462469 /ORGANISM="unid. sp., Strain CCMP2135" /LENGTH=403 /DNA_ID=CAMNT_0044392833 /DNA_START=53 /DNA_END=1264 /DNA_ORIENTATION=+